MFVMLMFVVSMTIAGCAAFFSVKGIGLLFAGSFLSVIIMASCLEAGKLMAASFLYRNWKRLSWWLKMYLTGATLLLMLITSLGIFGFLSDAYEYTKTKVELYESQIAQLQEENTVTRQQIDTIKITDDVTRTQTNTTVQGYRDIYDNYVNQQQTRVDQLNNRLDVLDKELQALQSSPGGIFSNKDKKIEQLKQEQADERQEINTKLNTIDAGIQQQYDIFMGKVDTFNKSIEQDKTTDRLKPLYDKVKTNEQQVADLKLQISDTDIGSFRFIARSFDVDADTAVKWFIIMIVVVFDPLAVCLIIGYNAMLLNREQSEESGPFAKLHNYMKNKKIASVHMQQNNGDVMRPRHRPDN